MECIGKKLLLCLFILIFNVRFNGGYLWGAELVIGNPIEIPAATIYSPELHLDIDLDRSKQLCQKAVDKYGKFENSEVLIIQNTTSGIFYIFLGGLMPQKDLLLDEIDALKVFGCSNLRNDLARLLENPEDIKRNKVKAFEDACKKYFQKVGEYITFWKEKFDGISQQNIQKLYEQFQAAQDKLFNSIGRIHGQDLRNLLETIDHLQLNLPENQPFNHFNELFTPELLLIYVIQNDVMINDFHFATFIQQNPLYIGLYYDMSLPCEAQFAWFTNRTDRAGKRLIVASVVPSAYPTRFPNSQFLRYNFLPPFIKIAFPKKEFQH
ncbi:MAG: hypothetical protein LBD60_03720 [Puniceicoccales bacterium]|jgi:hypothetical protein|nr:hypothetical protein [Puniceicoccales bacterium]